VIWGERDRALLPVLIDGLEKLIYDVRIERWTDASHWLVHEHPDRVNLTIRRFLAE
jgi:pimeloyl-ACP methyl ester carboxylesterase